METPGLTRPSRPEAGFSMVEMLMVAFIMAIGLLGLLTLQGASLSSATAGRERGTAILLAHNFMDAVTAEGILSSGERMQSATGTVTTGGYRYIDPLLYTAHASTAAETLYFDITGAAVTAASPNRIFTLTWQRDAGVLAGPKNAVANFVVNVQWQELVRTNGGATANASKYFSVGRNVRI